MWTEEEKRMIMVEEIKQHLNWIKSLHDVNPEQFSLNRVIDETFGYIQGIIYCHEKYTRDYELAKEITSVWTAFHASLLFECKLENTKNKPST